ncbi:magnesium transporter CorA family protein [Candidatus Bathyarchaeota archaeon]|nr:MAG: magnesium transporter CorA family protein [Candidatus Bathyarchaeota archaeon]
MITLTLLKSNGGARSETVTVFPEQIGSGEMLWVDAESPTDQELADLRQRFGLDEYAVEDVIHRNQRPKMEDYGKNVFAVVHVPVVKGHSSEIVELFVFFQKNWIITIHSVDSELIHSVDARIRARGLSPLTTSPTPDLLFYIFLDFAVDAYYPILDEEENRLEEIDKKATTTFKTRVKRMENIVAIITTIEGVRKRLMALRRSLTPTRDMLGMVMRGAVPFVADASLRSFRDVYDHSFQLLETIDNDRDRTSDVRDLYISLHSASTDNTIKVLTLVATIFLPLTLLAGIYGMNFTPGFSQPGTGDPLGFYVLILAMIFISLGFVYTFKRSGWI